MTGSARALSSRARRPDARIAAAAWLARAFDAPSGEARELTSWWGKRSAPSRQASLHAARALALGSGGSALVTHFCETLVREQRADGGFDAGAAAAISDAATTALSVELLCAEHARSSGLGDVIARACERLAAGAVQPDVVRALAAASQANAMRDGPAAVLRATSVLESDFDTHALQPLGATHAAADRAHAWHVAAAALGLDMRRHPAVQQCTLALIQRAEAGAGELFDAYTKEGRISGYRADTCTAARVALALFAVDDAIVGPRAAFAAELVLDVIAARTRDGAVRAGPARYAPCSVTATAHFVEALRLALARAEMPWSLPRAAASSIFARRA